MQMLPLRNIQLDEKTRQVLGNCNSASGDYLRKHICGTLLAMDKMIDLLMTEKEADIKEMSDEIKRENDHHLSSLIMRWLAGKSDDHQKNKIKESE